MKIDIGPAAPPKTYQIDKVQQLLDAVRDELPADATQAQIDDLTVQYVIGDLRTPKTARTVRTHFIQYWSVIQPLAHREPEMFDAIILEMAEILS